MRKFTSFLILGIAVAFFLGIIIVILGQQKGTAGLFLNTPGMSTKPNLKANWQWVSSHKKLYNLNIKETNLTLKQLWQRFPGQAQRLKALLMLRLDTPYQLGCLGEGKGRDKDPLFRLDVTDCTVFVLTTVALLHSRTLEEAKEMMKPLNYRPSLVIDAKREYKISFENRLHFTTERNEVSPYFEDLTSQFADASKIKTKTIILNKVKPDGHRLIDIKWEKKTSIKYIPTKYINNELFAKLPEVVGVAFLRNEDEKIGLDIQHEGFLVDRKFLFHATTLKGRVVKENFFDYYLDNGHPRFDGIILFAIK